MKGDHGQHGDVGPLGYPGVAGERGATGQRGTSGDRGQIGDTGPVGARGPSLWLPYVLMGVAVIVALAFFQHQAGKTAELVHKNRTTIARIERIRADTRRDAAETHKALCALRADLQRRVKGTVQFLSEHPNGIPGIPAKTLRDGLVNQQRTIAALRSLRCP